MGSKTAVPATAPWEAVPAKDQLFVLITGANSGVGLGTVQRLIDEFLDTRPLTAHLTIIPTTRSSSKSFEAVQEIREYVEHAAKTSPGLARRMVASNDGVLHRWHDAVARIHILSLPLDLCDLRQVRQLATTLRYGTVSNPPGLEGEYLTNVRIPRIDSIICNAAYGGWSGIHWPKAMYSIFFKGIIQTATWPDFKLALPTSILNERPEYNYPVKPLLGEVFCASFFGHYLLAHSLLPLMSRTKTDTVAPGRVIWSSSIEAVGRHFSIEDIQCFLRPEAYESCKRLIDLTLLTHKMPAARPYSSKYLAIDDDAEAARDRTVAPNMYLTHPGVVASTLFPLPWFLFWAYQLSLLLSRWLGSPWHPMIGYRGAKAAAWIVLENQETLDANDAQRYKWGSSTDFHLRTEAKPTEVEGYGWEGVPVTPEYLGEGDSAVGALRRAVGRNKSVKPATGESIAAFEETGARLWQQLEDMRAQWDQVMEEE